MVLCCNLSKRKQEFKEHHEVLMLKIFYVRKSGLLNLKLVLDVIYAVLLFL